MIIYNSVYMNSIHEFNAPVLNAVILYTSTTQSIVFIHVTEAV